MHLMYMELPILLAVGDLLAMDQALPYGQCLFSLARNSPEEVSKAPGSDVHDR